MRITDGYTHCGLSKYEPIEKVRAVMASALVERAVLVQHLGEFDNSYIETTVAADPEHLAGVCLVNHDSGDAVRDLEHLARRGVFRGVRLTTHACLACPDLPRAASDLGLIMVLFAPEGMAAYLPALLELLDDRPDTRLVLTHLGTPDLSREPSLESCREALRLADYPGTYLQLSGMKMCCPWPHEPLHGLVAEGFERFGASRIYWGSNYPVVGSEEDYLRDLRLLLDGRLPIPEDALPAVAGESAERLWFSAEEG